MDDDPGRSGVQAPWLRLQRVDPARNMRRFYVLGVQGDLFGGADLVREWGRIGRPGRIRVEHYQDEAGALSALQRWSRSKHRRGYEGPAGS